MVQYTKLPKSKVGVNSKKKRGEQKKCYRSNEDGSDREKDGYLYGFPRECSYHTYSDVIHKIINLFGCSRKKPTAVFKF